GGGGVGEGGGEVGGAGVGGGAGVREAAAVAEAEASADDPGLRGSRAEERAHEGQRGQEEEDRLTHGRSFALSTALGDNGYTLPIIRASRPRGSSSTRRRSCQPDL